MKRIFLIGDSIRMGYDKYVKDSLAGSCEVYYSGDNARFAEYTLRYLHEWKRDLDIPDDIDLVHWNAGLWDALEMFGDEPLTNIGYYSELILRIHKRLRMLFPKAKLVFATTTAVNESGFDEYYQRHNSYIEKLNSAAISVLSGTDAIINDLYSVTADCPPEYHSDATHYYTDRGTGLIGSRVLAVISRELSVDIAGSDGIKALRENYSSETVGY